MPAITALRRDDVTSAGRWQTELDSASAAPDAAEYAKFLKLGMFFQSTFSY